MSNETKRSILIIDDDAALRFVARTTLTHSGFAAHEAKCVAEGLTLLETLTPSLILLDFELPGRTGIEFLEIRSQNPNLLKIPVITLSGITDRSILQRAMVLGAAQVLLKPFKPGEVLSRIRMVLRARSYGKIRFPKQKPLQVTAEIRGTIHGMDERYIKVSTEARLNRGKPAVLQTSEKATGQSFSYVCKVAPRKVTFESGKFSQILERVAISPDRGAAPL